MPHKSVHVTPKGNAWKVKTSGSKRAVKITLSQDEAIQIARRIAMNNGLELVVHRNKKARSNAPLSSLPNENSTDTSEIG